MAPQTLCACVAHHHRLRQELAQERTAATQQRAAAAEAAARERMRQEGIEGVLQQRLQLLSGELAAAQVCAEICHAV